MNVILLDNIENLGKIGDLVSVKAGEKIPVDGVVVDGSQNLG